MKGPSEETIVSMLNDRPDEMSPTMRRFLENELDWIRRGRPKDELIPEHVAERMQVEAGGPIPERFEHLQYLNKPRR